ncbi:MAG: hypothetical protein KJ896_00105, partial [Nanoarchaeota archaeon]|nr:hypothetical protein [Nanoarchaeota archaeon]
MKLIKALILDFNRTLFDPNRLKIGKDSYKLLQLAKEKGWKLALISIGNEDREQQIKPILNYFDFVRIVRKKSVKDFEYLVKIMGTNCSNTL